MQLRHIRRHDRWYLPGALIILLVVTFLSYRDWSVFQRSASQVQHSRALLMEIGQVLSSVKDTESGQRGFLLTGDQQYLDIYQKAVNALPQQLATLHALVAEEPELRPRVATLESLVREKLSELNETVDLRQNEGFDAALRAMQTNREKYALDDILKVGDDLQNEVYSGLMRGVRQRQQQGSQTRLTTAIGAALLFAFLLLATVEIDRSTAERDRLIGALEAANDRTAQSRDLWQTTLASIADAVIVTDGAASVTFLNGVAEKVTGWTLPEGQGHKLDELLAIVNEDGTVAENPAAKALREGSVVTLTDRYLLISRDGARRPIDASAAPIRNRQGNLEGAVLVFRDTSRRRKSQAELQRLNKALIRINEDLQQFSYAASHDLKEPLRTVSTYLQLIRTRYSGKPLDGEALELFEVAIKGALRMNALVDALLEYSRAGEVVDLKMVPIEAGLVVRDVMASLDAAIAESGAEITVDTLPVITANPLHLAQVFENLITNALKYRSIERPRIHITATEGVNEWTFAVEDNGIGIPPEYQSQIFGMFKRLHGSRYPGTGIGLATCKKIIERSGGAIGVESQHGKGSRFFFSLPKIAARYAAGESA